MDATVIGRASTARADDGGGSVPVDILGGARADMVAIVFIGVALLASWAPAREATRVDPREALPAE